MKQHKSNKPSPSSAELAKSVEPAEPQAQQESKVPQVSSELKVPKKAKPATSSKPPKPLKNSPWKIAADAPREKLLQKGAEYLSDTELLAIFLRVGYRGKNVMELAADLIREQGLQWLLTANRDDFCSKKGLGNAKYVQLQSVMELARRYLEDVMKRESSPITSSKKLKEYLMHKLGASPREIFACIFMDSRYRVLEYREMFTGTIDVATVHPREIMRRALEVNAAHLIIAHNHPSGMLKPSAADKYATQTIKSACDLLNIELIDHFIISGTDTLSFAEHGLL